MRLTTPSWMSPILRPFAAGGESRLGISVLSAWSFSGAPLSVQDLWPRFARAAGGTVLDQGIPKSASEYLLVGHAHSAHPVTHLPVAVELGEHRKVLNVVGDRHWHRGVPTEPRPFTKMPLGWDHAFGGDGYAGNPLGRGFTTREPDGVALPNVEVPGRMVSSPSERPPPAGLGPFGIDWPQRTRGLGTYDRAWFEQDFPGFARDIDWRVHNVAPLDQRFEEPFRPGQRFVLHNLVEGSARVEVTIPPVAARCFTYGDEASPELVEVPLALRTVWLVPDEDMFVLVFHGAQKVQSLLASDVAGLLLALDRAEAPRDLAHFAAALERRLDKELGAAEMLDDRPLMPEGLAFPGFEARAEDLTIPERRGVLGENLRAGAELRRREALRQFREAGFEGGEELFPPHAPPKLPEGSLAEQIRAVEAEAAKQKAAAEARLAEMRAEAVAELERAGFDPSFLDRPPSGPPPILAATQLAMLTEICESARAAGRPLEVFERQLADPDHHRELAERERMGRQAYRMSAHFSEGMPELELDRAEVVRAFVEIAIRERRCLAETDLTGAELAGLDLSGMDLTGAWLEGANLQGTNLSGARLDGAVLAKAHLGEAVLRATSLRQANLGRARLFRLRIEDCDLGEAILTHADLRESRVSASDLRGADLREALFEGSSFDACDLSELTFLKTSLSGVVFTGCKLDSCNLIEVTLDGTRFTRCRLGQVVFVTCTGVRTELYEAMAENARFALGCRFERGDFRRAKMPRSTLRGNTFSDCAFDEADLSGSDLAQGDFAGSSFYRARLVGALATECDLRSASMAGANLMNAILEGADLRGTDLRGTNLFAANLGLVRADGGTSLEGALVTRVRRHPMRKETT